MKRRSTGFSPRHKASIRVLCLCNPMVGRTDKSLRKDSQSPRAPAPSGRGAACCAQGLSSRKDKEKKGNLTAQDGVEVTQVEAHDAHRRGGTYPAGGMPGWHSTSAVLFPRAPDLGCNLEKTVRLIPVREHSTKFPRSPEMKKLLRNCQGQ